MFCIFCILGILALILLLASLDINSGLNDAGARIILLCGVIFFLVLPFVWKCTTDFETKVEGPFTIYEHKYPDGTTEQYLFIDGKRQSTGLISDRYVDPTKHQIIKKTKLGAWRGYIYFFDDIPKYEVVQIEKN